MQSSDERGVVIKSNYLICGDRPDKARIHHDVCEQRCKKIKKCDYYNDWYKEIYDEDFIKKKRVVRKKTRRKKKK